MNKWILIILLSVFGFSCDNPDNNKGYENALRFFNEYSEEFLSSELNKYQSGPRGGYESYPYDSAFFRIIPIKSETIFVLNIENFLKKFNFPVDIQDIYFRGELALKELYYSMKLESYDHSYIRITNDSIEVNKHSTENYQIPLNTFSQNPIKYVFELEKLREKYRIIHYMKIQDWGLIKVYFSQTDYLIYYPDVNNIDGIYRDFWNSKYKSGKKLNKNWVYYKSKEPLDLG